MYADPPNRFTSAFRAAFLIGIDQYTEGSPMSKPRWLAFDPSWPR